MFNHQKKLMKIHRHDKAMNSISKKFIAQDKKNVLNEKTKLINNVNQYMQIREDNSKKIADLVLNFQTRKPSFAFPLFRQNEKFFGQNSNQYHQDLICLLYTSPSPRDGLLSRMPSSA